VKGRPAGFTTYLLVCLMNGNFEYWEQDVRLPDLNEAALRRTLRVRRTEQWLLVG
jgi:hypothetical protein